VHGALTENYKKDFMFTQFCEGSRCINGNIRKAYVLNENAAKKICFSDNSNPGPKQNIVQKIKEHRLTKSFHYCPDMALGSDTVEVNLLTCKHLFCLSMNY